MHPQITLPIVLDRDSSAGNDTLRSAIARRLGLREMCARLFDAVRLPVALVTDPASLSLACVTCLSALSGRRIVRSTDLARGLGARLRNQAACHRPRHRAFGFCPAGAPTACTLTVDTEEKR
jgi:hypothetical protein